MLHPFYFYVKRYENEEREKQRKREVIDIRWENKSKEKENLMHEPIHLHEREDRKVTPAVAWQMRKQNCVMHLHGLPSHVVEL